MGWPTSSAPVLNIFNAIKLEKWIAWVNVLILSALIILYILIYLPVFTCIILYFNVVCSLQHWSNHFHLKLCHFIIIHKGCFPSIPFQGLGNLVWFTQVHYYLLLVVQMNAEVEDSREPLLMESVKYLMPWVGSQHKKRKIKDVTELFLQVNLSFVCASFHTTSLCYAGNNSVCSEGKSNSCLFTEWVATQLIKNDFDPFSVSKCLTRWIKVSLWDKNKGSTRTHVMLWQGYCPSLSERRVQGQKKEGELRS